MKWLPRSERQELNSRRGWRFWSAGMERRERDWRGWKARSKGLSGSEGSWHLGDDDGEVLESCWKDTTASKVRWNGEKVARTGLREYVKARRMTAKMRHIRAAAPRSPLYWRSKQTTGARLLPCALPLRKHSFRVPGLKFRDCLTSLSLEASDLDLLANELCHDFVMEPKPYLVASVILFLEVSLILLQFYRAIWNFWCFLFRFVP